MRFIVTTHHHLPGVRLSKPGHWGNLPFDCYDAAEEHARANGATSVERETGKARTIPR